MVTKVKRPCIVCGAESKTSVAWPRMKVRWHWRCEEHWIDWWAIGLLFRVLGLV